MANERLNMTVQEEVLRLKSLGHSKRAAARLLGLDRDTIRRYWNGPPPLPDKITPDWAQELDWEAVNKELNSAPKKIVYEELQDVAKLPSYQAFCQYLRNNSPPPPPEVTVKIERLPGQSIEVDYSGDSLSILNPSTGEIRKVELFVGALSFSSYFFAEFTYTQRLEDFVQSHVRMFNFFQGTTSTVVPDNCKCAVTKSGKHDPVINATYQDMCKHYGVVVDPADPYCPRHKPNVERAIGFIQTNFFPRVRNRTFTSLVEINRELHIWMQTALDKLISGRGLSRREFFQKEQAALRPLPQAPYQLFYFKKARVHPDCHFQHERNFYSVPHQFVGKEIDVKFNSQLVHAYFECSRIATHKTLVGRFHYSTHKEHYPEKKMADLNYHVAHARSEAAKIGPNATLTVEKLLTRAEHPLKSLRKIQGILRLAHAFEKHVLEYALEMALSYEKLNYHSVQKFAKNYQHPKNDISHTAPQRELQLVCLQGGNDE